MNHGKIAYEAYVNKTGGKSLVSGDALPAWEVLSKNIQEAWDVASLAVCDARDKEILKAREEVERSDNPMHSNLALAALLTRRGFEGIQHGSQNNS
jgi:hypothetical protein